MTDDHRAHRDRRDHGGEPQVRVLETDLLRACSGRFPARFELGTHRHERPVLAIALGGDIEEIFPRSTHACPAATVFTEPAGEDHGGRTGSDGVRVVIVQPGDVSDDLWRPAIPLFDDILHFRDGRAAILGRRLERELRTRDAGTELAVQGLALEIVALAARMRAPVDPTPPTWLGRVRDLVHDRFLDCPSLREIAREADVHPAHLSRVFRRHYRIPIGAYVRALRLEWAARRLDESEDPIPVIALQAGFYDQSHFTQAFKRHVGQTPARYRSRS